jgi:predicted nucleotidyltransferase
MAAMDPADLDRVAHAHGIRLILLFGSSVTGKTHPRSDVDVAVLLERPDLSLEDHARLLGDLQHIFPRQELDLAILNRADPLFLKKILEHCRLLHGAPRDLARLRLYAFKRYHDHRKYLELERRFVTRAVEGLAGG